VARTNVEESAFAKALELANEMGWKAGEALGALTWLWHDSQAKYRHGGKGREILRWSKLRLEDEEAVYYLRVLEELELIRPVTDEASALNSEFEIAGNEDEVARLLALKERSKKGVDSRRRKSQAEHERMLSLTEAVQPELDEPQDEPENNLNANHVDLIPDLVNQQVDQKSIQVDPVQFSSVQCSAVQISSERKTKKKTIARGSTSPPAGADPDGPSPTALTWRAYRDEFAHRYGKAPPWNAKTAGQLRQFVSRIPASEAPEVAAFYLRHNGYQYANNMHPVGLLLRDAEKIRTEWATRTVITSAAARKLDQRQATHDAFSGLIADAESRERGHEHDDKS
jgi:hypothetical protein